MVGNNYGTHPPFFRDIWSHKTSETLIFFLSSQYSHGTNKKSMISSLLQAINSRTFLSGTALELRTTNFKNLTRNRPILFQTRIGGEIWVSKNRDLSPGSPRGVYMSRNDPKQKICSGNIGQPSTNVMC